MATYSIGDVHGCHRTLQALLKRVGFDPAHDRLWMVGDLVNRGPGSVETLRWAIDHDHLIRAVMGNHDLHAIAVAAGYRPPKPRDTFERLLAAPDRDDLLSWLAARPLLIREDPWWMVHAGLSPAWTPERAALAAREAESALAGPAGDALIRAVYDEPAERPWSEHAEDFERHRWTLRATTRLRTCRPDSVPCEGFAGPPQQAPKGCRPWFEQLGPSWEGHRLVFGHCAALGVHLTERACGLDSGCVYGGRLTALRLEDGQAFQQPLVDRV